MRTSELAHHPTGSPVRRARRVAVVVASLLALGVGGAAMAATGGARSPEREATSEAVERMSGSDVPAEVYAPGQEGAASVQSFGGFLRAVREMNHGRPAPRPSDLDGLRAVTAASATGTVTAVALVPEVIELGEMRAARIDLIIDLGRVDTFDAPKGVDTSRWVRTVWTGDPVLLDGMVHRLRTELGPGPIGAQAVVFGNLIDTPEGPVLGVYDGLVDDGSAVARLSLVLAAPSEELRTVESVIQQMGG